MILTYTFHQTKSAEVGCEVPLLSNYLYENEYQSIFWMLFETSTKRFIVCGDAFPLKYKVSLGFKSKSFRFYLIHSFYSSMAKLLTKGTIPSNCLLDMKNLSHLRNWNKLFCMCDNQSVEFNKIFSTHTNRFSRVQREVPMAVAINCLEINSTRITWIQ